MPIYGFDENSTRRIAHTVRLVEGGRTPKHEAKGSESSRGGIGVRCMLGTISTGAWNKGTSATVKVFSGEPGSESSAMTVSAHNYFADISTSANTARWVALSNNGYGWMLIAAECD